MNGHDETHSCSSQFLRTRLQTAHQPWRYPAVAPPSVHAPNWLVHTTETECVYCAVRTESLNIIQVNLDPVAIAGHAICDGQSGMFSKYFGFHPVRTISDIPHTHPRLNVSLTRMSNWRSLGTFQKKLCFFRKYGNNGIEKYEGAPHGPFCIRISFK